MKKEVLKKDLTETKVKIKETVTAINKFFKDYEKVDFCIIHPKDLEELKIIIEELKKYNNRISQIKNIF